MSLALEPLPWPSPAEAASSGDAEPAGCSGLSPRETVLLLLASDVCRGAFESPFETDAEKAIAEVGVSLDELRELFRHLAPYAGLSAAAAALERLVEITGNAAPAADSKDGRPATEVPAYPDWSLDGFRSLDPIFARQLCLVTADLWDRPHLSPRERALATIAVDIAGGSLGCSFAAHLELARRHGVDGSQVSAAVRLLEKRSPGRARQALEALAMADSA